MYHATLVTNPETGQATLCLKGAPEATIARSTHYREGELTEAQRQTLVRRVDQLGAEGYRVIAVADAPAPELPLEDNKVQGLRILGFFCLEDPLRKESAPTLKLLMAAGVQPIMITGDHAVTATRIASELGLGSGQSVLQGGEIDSLDDDALAERLTHTSVVARAAPAHKLRLVRVFQQMGRVVGMTGDGGNDAPAIRFADVGIALGQEATQAARDASDMVVLDASLQSIGTAIAEGRALWGSVRDASSLLVGGNMGEIGFMTLGGVASGAAPLNARQLMLLNLFTDVAPALTIAQGSSRQRDEDAILNEGPETALGQQLTDDIVWRGLVTGSSAGIAYSISRALMRDPQISSTTSLVSLVGTQLGQTLLTGDSRDLKVIAASVLSAAGLLAIVQTPHPVRVVAARYPVQLFRHARCSNPQTGGF